MQHILVVDDTPAIRSILVRTFISEGYQTSCAASAENALEVLKIQQIDLMITDESMPPGKDGLWLAKEVRMAYPDLPIVLHTANIKAVSPHVNASVSKPDTLGLVDAVKRLI